MPVAGLGARLPIVELSTTVYSTPLIVCLYPTSELGHLQVPFSK